MKTVTTKDLEAGGKVKLTLTNGSVVNGRWDKRLRRFIIEVDEKTQEQEAIQRKLKSPGYGPRTSFSLPEPLMQAIRDRQEQSQTKTPPPIDKSFKVDENVKDEVFKAKIRDVLLDNKYTRRTFAQRRGKLDPRRLAMATTTNKVFYHTKSKHSKDYVVALLVDCSGSMYEPCGSRFDKRAIEHARESAALLQAILKDITDLTMIAYGDGACVVEHPSQLDDRGGTNEVAAIKLAYETFDKHPSAKQKLMITITDGSPNNTEETNKLISQRKGDVLSIAIAIRSHHPQNKTETIRIEDTQQLKPALIKVLKKHVGGY